MPFWMDDWAGLTPVWEIGLIERLCFGTDRGETIDPSSSIIATAVYLLYLTPAAVESKSALYRLFADHVFIHPA